MDTDTRRVAIGAAACTVAGDRDGDADGAIVGVSVLAMLMKIEIDMAH